MILFALWRQQAKLFTIDRPAAISAVISWHHDESWYHLHSIAVLDAFLNNGRCIWCGRYKNRIHVYCLLCIRVIGNTQRDRIGSVDWLERSCLEFHFSKNYLKVTAYYSFVFTFIAGKFSSSFSFLSLLLHTSGLFLSSSCLLIRLWDLGPLYYY